MTKDNEVTPSTSGLVPLLRHTFGSAVVPGDKIGRTIVSSTTGGGKIRLTAGPGTYLRGGEIHASIIGTLQGKSLSEEDRSSMIITVEPTKGLMAQQEVIYVGQTVLARIIRIQNNQAIVSILAVQDLDRLLTYCPEGAIRREDIRSGATEQVQLQTAFRPDDLVVARVLSLGDSRRYFLSTADPSLGVIYALSSTSGKPMIPVSWKEMECPETGLKEPRKCARPKNASFAEE